MEVAGRVANNLPEAGPMLPEQMTDAGEKIASGVSGADREFAKGVDEHTSPFIVSVQSQLVDVELGIVDLLGNANPGIDALVPGRPDRTDRGGTHCHRAVDLA